MAPILLRSAFPLMVIGGLALSPNAGTAAANARPVIQHIPSSVTAIANWRCPYCNIDRRYDAGNDTGDAMVEQLNQEQLNRGPSVYHAPRPNRYRRPPPPYSPYAPGY
jgi:hypothetical protein